MSLQEDSDVLSMNSYSSEMNLLPTQATTRADLPNLVLGTFAAAAVPIRKQMLALPKLNTTEASENSDEIDESVAPLSSNYALNRGTQFEPFESISPRSSIHISSLDVEVNFIETDSESFEAYSKSDFESSTPPSSAPSASTPSKTGDEQSGSISSSSSSSNDASQSKCNVLTTGTFAAAISPLVPIVELTSPSVIKGCVVSTVDDTSKSDEGLFQISLSQEPSFSRPNSHIALNETHIVSRSGSDSSDESTFYDSADGENMEKQFDDGAGFYEATTLVVNPGPNPLIAKDTRVSIVDEGVHQIVHDGDRMCIRQYD